LELGDEWSGIPLFYLVYTKVPKISSKTSRSSSSSSSSARAELVGPSVLKYQAIFFLAFLDHTFLPVDNILVKVAWELFLMAFSADVPANFSFFQLPHS
jgi:hypothetical protein